MQVALTISPGPGYRGSNEKGNGEKIGSTAVNNQATRPTG
ncbi:hypothetical protein C900_02682 [Fulvivirga imtechensis AK7]|uniref:Uncharacterized protein n=1 Tax=Fulvivirga imtechensis AK7 TaxID=1237149 RepID=L8K2C0_9BACT|nr:hypothetical protein C900_02682 [Fulvivirga imtechensis AK7]